MSDIQSLTTQALADVAAASSPDALEDLRVALLGKNGSITAQLKQLGALPADARKAIKREGRATEKETLISRLKKPPGIRPPA